MGCKISNPFAPKEARIVMLGLDNSGKTSILRKLKPNCQLEDSAGPKESCFNVEEVRHKNYNFTIFDMGGQKSFRPLWKHYNFMGEAKVLLFVVDSSDKERVDEAQEELEKISQVEEVRDAVYLILAHKIDLDTAMHPVELIERLKLDEVLEGRLWEIMDTSATTGENILEGLDWICTQLEKKEKM